MSQIVIHGVKPYDGAYDIDFNREFSAREWGWIKRFAGYLPLEVDDRTFGDPEMAVVIALIAMHREGRIQTSEARATFDKLADAPFGTSITVEVDTPEEDDEQRPPPPSSSGNGATSGADSKTSSATPNQTLDATGTPGLVTSPSAPTTSAA